MATREAQNKLNSLSESVCELLEYGRNGVERSNLLINQALFYHENVEDFLRRDNLRSYKGRTDHQKWPDYFEKIASTPSVEYIFNLSQE